MSLLARGQVLLYLLQFQLSNLVKKIVVYQAFGSKNSDRSN
jgi:hypothetical protein